MDYNIKMPFEKLKEIFNKVKKSNAVYMENIGKPAEEYTRNTLLYHLEDFKKLLIEIKNANKSV